MVAPEVLKFIHPPKKITSWIRSSLNILTFLGEQRTAPCPRRNLRRWASFGSASSFGVWCQTLAAGIGETVRLVQFVRNALRSHRSGAHGAMMSPHVTGDVPALKRVVEGSSICRRRRSDSVRRVEPASPARGRSSMQGTYRKKQVFS